jgi:hypothetical protein
MSYAEEPEKTTLRFSNSWSEQVSSNRLVPNLISLNKETNRKPDTYHFWVENRILIDPESGKPVLNFVLPGVEKKVAEELQTWAGKNEKGLAFWISPSLEGVYPCAKVILHRISYTFDGKKVIQNSVILFDANFENPELLRQTLFTQADTEENISNILQWISEKSSQQVKLPRDSNEDEVVIRKQAIYYSEMFQRGMPREDIIEKMKRTGFLGKNPISCPGASTSFSNLIDSRASISLFNEARGWHHGKCRICHASTWVGPCSICKPCEFKF